MNQAREQAGVGVSDRPTLAYLALAGGVLASAFSSILTKASGAPAIIVGFWRLFLTVLLFAGPLLWQWRRGALPHVQRRDWLLTLLSGMALAAHFYFWNTSLAYTTVAASTILVTTHPFMVLIGGYFLYGERVRPWGIAGVVLAMLGTVAIGLGDLSGTGGPQALLGDLYALLGAVTVAAYFLIGRAVRRHMHVLQYTTTVYGVAAGLLLAAALALRLPLANYPAASWWAFVGLAVGPTVLGHTVFNWVLRYLKTIVVSLSILGEPVGGTILAWLILGQQPGPTTLGGALLILGGIAVFLLNVREKA